MVAPVAARVNWKNQVTEEVRARPCWQKYLLPMKGLPWEG